MALAVSGLRRVEGLWLEARALGDQYHRHLTSSTGPDRPDYRITVGEQVETRVQQLTLDYAERIDALAGKADDVLAVDPRVRWARAVVVDELRSVVRDSRAAAGRSALTLAPFPYAAAVEPALASARSRWHLDPGREPEPAPLVAAARPRKTPALHAESTGVRLLTYAGGRLLEIDIDGGVVVAERSLAGPFALVGDRLVVVEAGVAQVVGPENGRRPLGPAEDAHADGDGVPAVWLSRPVAGGQADLASLVSRRALDGTLEVAERRVDGYVAMAAGRWVVAITPQGDGPGGFVVHDVERPTFRFARKDGRVHGLAGGVLVWSTHDRFEAPGTLRVRDLARGVDRTLDAPTAGATASTVAFAPGVRSFAVAWSSAAATVPGDVPHAVWTYDVATLAAQATPLVTGPFVPALAWSRDGRWLFALGQVGNVERSTIAAWRVGSDVAEPLAIEGHFHTLTAL